MKSKNIRLLINHLNESRVVEPNDLGLVPLTFIYRKITVFFKTAPFIVVVPIAIISATGIVYVFGILAVRLVSLLQYGF